MPAIHRTIQLPTRPLRHSLSGTTKRYSSTQFRRSDFSGAGQGFTGSYEPGQPTVGPLAQASKSGAPRLTPSLLKEHLDKFVVGQAKAKKVTSVAIYNHYQRIRELRRLEAEQQGKKEQDARRMLKERERNAHPLESMYEPFPFNPRIGVAPGMKKEHRSLFGLTDEIPGHVETVEWTPTPIEDEPDLGSKPLEDNDATIIEKSNLLLLGPSGVGKTYSIPQKPQSDETYD